MGDEVQQISLISLPKSPLVPTRLYEIGQNLALDIDWKKGKRDCITDWEIIFLEAPLSRDKRILAEHHSEERQAGKVIFLPTLNPGKQSIN